ncbi:hypothetical protein [Sphingomonas phage Birtae]|nr:hypothetical protein [Sphingomonas phage Birtae]
MAFTTGNATDYRDLLDKLRAYLVANGWTVNDFALGATLLDKSRLYVTGPGQVGGQEVNVSIDTEANSGTNAYAWRVCGHPDYDPVLPFGQQLNNSPLHYFLLWPNAMSYWFYVNDRRFVVIAKIGVYYMSMYAGFFLPYALPEEYPFPYFIGATTNYLDVYNRFNSGLRTFCDPGAGAASYMERAGVSWQSILNAGYSDNNSDYYYGVGNEGACIWPYRNPMVEDDFNASGEIAWSFFRLLRPLANGKMPMWQAHVVDVANETVAGTLDGVFVTGGFNRVPEQIVTIDAQDYRLFININRNTPKHYFAIEEA